MAFSRADLGAHRLQKRMKNRSRRGIVPGDLLLYYGPNYGVATIVGRLKPHQRFAGVAEEYANPGDSLWVTISGATFVRLEEHVRNPALQG